MASASGTPPSPPPEPSRAPRVLRRVLQIALLAVAVAGLVVFLLKERARQAALATAESSEHVQAAPRASTDAARKPAVVVHYFFTNYRCNTCRKLEAYTEEAVQSGFASELESGSIQWKPINTDEPQNAHFIKEFSLKSKAVILTAPGGKAPSRFKDLDQIWDLVSDKEMYIAYIQSELRKFHKGS